MEFLDPPSASTQTEDEKLSTIQEILLTLSYNGDTDPGKDSQDAHVQRCVESFGQHFPSEAWALSALGISRLPPDFYFKHHHHGSSSAGQSTSVSIFHDKERARRFANHVVMTEEQYRQGCAKLDSMVGTVFPSAREFKREADFMHLPVPFVLRHRSSTQNGRTLHEYVLNKEDQNLSPLQMTDDIGRKASEILGREFHHKTDIYQLLGSKLLPDGFRIESYSR